MSLEENLIKQIAFLEGKLAFYENDGVGKLYHALNRKANEMADLLNNNDLTKVQMEEPKDKTFERLQKIWSDAEGVSNAIKSLGLLAGINMGPIDIVKEQQKIRKPFSPESVADAVGELAGGKTR
jgi:hypothetical protein